MLKGEREAPADLLAELRVILPTVALYNVHGPRWLLLDHRPNADRIAQGERLKKREYDNLKSGRSVNRNVLAIGDLLIEGYSLIGQYEWVGEAPRAMLLNDLRKKQAATDSELEAALARAEAGSERCGEDGAEAGVAEFIEQDGRSLHAITARARKTFVQPGV